MGHADQNIWDTLIRTYVARGSEHMGHVDQNIWGTWIRSWANFDPQSVIADQKYRMIVADFRNKRVVILDQNGNWLLTIKGDVFGGEGSEYVYPWGYSSLVPSNQLKTTKIVSTGTGTMCMPMLCQTHDSMAVDCDASIPKNTWPFVCPLPTHL